MKVLVTGGCGFLGSHVCEFYSKKGDTVISYDNMTKHELERTGFATKASKNYHRGYLKSLGIGMNNAKTIYLEKLVDFPKASKSKIQNWGIMGAAQLWELFSMLYCESFSEWGILAMNN